MESCQKIVDEDVSGLPLLSFVNFEFNGMEGLIQRGGYTGDYGFRIILPIEAQAEIKDIILSSEFEVKEISEETHNILVTSFSNITTDDIVNYLKNPYEYGIKHLLDFTNDDYLYHEIINQQSQEANNNIVAFIAESLPHQLENTQVVFEDLHGEIIYYSYSYKLNKYIGYILIDKNFSLPGLSFQLMDNTEQKIKTVSLPFYKTKSFEVEIV